MALHRLDSITLGVPDLAAAVDHVLEFARDDVEDLDGVVRVLARVLIRGKHHFAE